MYLKVTADYFRRLKKFDTISFPGVKVFLFFLKPNHQAFYNVHYIEHATKQLVWSPKDAISHSIDKAVITDSGAERCGMREAEKMTKMYCLFSC